MVESALRQLRVPRYRTVLEQKIRERRMTLEEFAEFAETFARERGEPGTLSVRHLKRLIAGKGPNGRPLGPLRPATARLLERIFEVGADELLGRPGDQPHTGDRERGDTDEAKRLVIERGLSMSKTDLADRQVQRSRVGRSRVADALAKYYRADDELYQVRSAGSVVRTSVCTRADWLDLSCPPAGVRLQLAHDAGEPEPSETEAAARRLAEATALQVRLVDAPLYRLLDVEVNRGSVSGAVGLTSFMNYALSADLLEAELVDHLGAGGPTDRGSLPMRDRHLPDLEAVHELNGRLCAGGVLALCAIARPADPHRGPADYALLVQERSDQVVNAARRLSVIPKGFHQPLVDASGETSIGATLLREMEEELFGRGDVDGTAGPHRAVAPMHPSRLSEPMRWLTEGPDRLRMECTGFGFNLVSGNYEFASLIVIEDEEFWARYGGQVEANWETGGMRIYSSLDKELVTQLISDESWCNEGLFAFLQGVRRLCEIGGKRVDLPAVEVLGS
nr:transcriptional regulator [Amycolatopsis thermoflava]